ncbi:cytochrome P450 [Streptomyces halobius]|uniref:Cytochrome P450 n=1 Tax=Streptomyces halobius TaxID=2879846 RepID=A0ABY4M8U6_9ACTN|nr:cytochrome P450 [Streptomyces halobius]UQA93568.1 cytochrome P450 [Streptomyces halobius]
MSVPSAVPPRPAPPRPLPLRPVPGPRGLPGLGNLPAFGKDPLAFLVRLRDDFGDAVTWSLGPMRGLFLSHPQHIAELLTTREQSFDVLDILWAFRQVTGQSVLLGQGAEWRRKRGLVQPTVRPRQVRPYAATMVECARLAAERWRERERTDGHEAVQIDVHEEMALITQQIVLRTLFGNDLGDRTRALGQTMTVAEKVVSDELRGINLFLPGWVPTPGRRRLLAAVATIDAEVHRLISARHAGQVRAAAGLGRAGPNGQARGADADDMSQQRDGRPPGRSPGEFPPGAVAGDGMSQQREALPPGAVAGDGRACAGCGDRDDLLSRLLAARDGAGRPLSAEEVRDEAVTLWAAGHETTSTALTWAWCMLGQSPKVRALLDDELARVLGGRLPTIDDYDRLTWTQQIVKETLRLYPPAWAIATAAREGATLGGSRIPAGTTVWCSQWSTHRDPRWFPDPGVFRPERWGPDAPHVIPDHAWFPFGGGQRTCLGARFAQVEAVLLLATLAQSFHLDLAPGPVTPKAGLLLQPATPLRARVRRAG